MLVEDTGVENGIVVEVEVDKARMVEGSTRGKR